MCFFKSLIIIARMTVTVITCLALCSVLYTPSSFSPYSNECGVSVHISKPGGAQQACLDLMSGDQSSGAGAPQNQEAMFPTGQLGSWLCQYFATWQGRVSGPQFLSFRLDVLKKCYRRYMSMI